MKSVKHVIGLAIGARKVKIMVIYIQVSNYPNGIFKSAPDLARKIEYLNPDSPLICIDGEWGHHIVDNLKPLPCEIFIK